MIVAHLIRGRSRSGNKSNGGVLLRSRAATPWWIGQTTFRGSAAIFAIAILALAMAILATALSHQARFPQCYSSLSWL